MQYFGKILGAIIGLLSGIGFWGLFIGIIIGYIADKITNQNEYSLNKKQQKELFFRTIFQVMGHLTKSKGMITNHDIKMASFIMKKMKLSNQDCIIAKESFREGKKIDYPLRKNLRKIRSSNLWKSDLIKIFLEIQIQAALVDGSLHPNEKNILYIIVEELGISFTQFNYLLQILEKSKMNTNNYQSWWNNSSNSQEKEKYFYKKNQNKFTLLDACNILGVKTNDDFFTIKRAYKKLMSKNHPDKVLSQGYSSKMIEIAKEKTQKIQSAYNFIKKEKN